MHQAVQKIIDIFVDFARKQKAILLSLGVVFLVMLIAFLALAWSYQNEHKSDEIKLGVSFSIKYANELGVDPQANLDALVNDLGIKRLRLMSYWDLVEPRPNEFDFSSLDWQFKLAEEGDAKITLAMGQRQPRWPECHIPNWADALEGDDYQEKVDRFISIIAKRYKDSPALESYQLENEAQNELFARCRKVTPEQVSHEYDILKEFDPDHPIIINTSNQVGFPVFGQVGDKIGISIYKRTHFEALGRQNGWHFWYVPSEWHSFRAKAMDILHKKEIFIHELQAEPWGPKATVDLDLEEQNKTMDADKLRDITEYALSTGIGELYWWGGEWWYWRMTNFDDPSLWDQVRSIIEQAEQAQTIEGLVQ